MKPEGDYLVEFIFDDEELKNWLLQYVKAEPEAAIKLLSEAILALSPKTHEEKSSLED
jgi:hypothetical protein